MIGQEALRFLRTDFAIIESFTRIAQALNEGIKRQPDRLFAPRRGRAKWRNPPAHWHTHPIEVRAFRLRRNPERAIVEVPALIG